MSSSTTTPSATFASLGDETSFAQEEHKILALWDEIDAFKKSIAIRSPEQAYAFYDGPPFATGLPHYGHLVASTLKDIVPRYWTMRGHRVERRFGWDTHGLPIEMQIEKELGLDGPSSVRAFGVDKFNEACRSSVLKYTTEWERTIKRVGRWVDFQDDYKTMDLPFMESVWWVFKTLWEKGLVYRGVRVMPYSWRLSTPLSNFEAGLDYRDVQDPAITVRMPIDGDSDDAALLVWTTTPWTLPSNLAVAVGEDIDYERVKSHKDGKVYIIAAARRSTIIGDDVDVLSTVKGKDLVGLSYQPLFSYFADQKADGRFVVLSSSHVTTEDGTGLVHMAPAYGEDDFYACKKIGITPVDPVDDEGRFMMPVADYVGRNIKDADKDIIRALKDKGALYRHDTINHKYPYCWRSGTPLIYKTTPTWFVAVEKFRDRMAQLNESIHWVPEAVGQKRFGNWLKEARDWAISRNRFWGTPIPVWTCPSCGADTCLGSAQELAEKSGASIDDLHPHKIDHLAIQCSCGTPMKRISEVFDCWFESGAMPYAQVHYPFENKDAFEKAFPASFIAEGLDQTRGWFYTLVVLSTALFDKIPFKNVIVNGLVLAEDGSKMSKSKKNYPDPTHLVETYGADSLRAYLINSPVVNAEPLRFAESGVREVVRTVLIPLQNAWSFFTQYANIDGWNPSRDLPLAPAVSERPELDRWILSVLQSLIADVNTQMEGYYLYKVVPPMLGFIDHLTNWYIRRSRRRFWRSADDAAGQRDKLSAYATLFEVLTTFAKVVAPVLPFMAERVYRHLVVDSGYAKETNAPESVHLCDYPVANDALIHADLERDMAAIRSVVGRARALREKHKLKTRQPLPTVTVVCHIPWVRSAVEKGRDIIADEINVKNVLALADDDSLCSVTLKANFKTLGKRMGKRMKEAADAVQKLTRDELRILQDGGSLPLLDLADDKLTLEDVLATRTPIGHVVLESEGDITVAIDTDVTPELRREGLMREVISNLQRARKDAGLAVTDRIRLALHTDEADLQEAIQQNRDLIASEVLAVELSMQAPSSVEAGTGVGFDSVFDIDGLALRAHLQKA